MPANLCRKTPADMTHLHRNSFWLAMAHPLSAHSRRGSWMPTVARRPKAFHPCRRLPHICPKPGTPVPPPQLQSGNSYPFDLPPPGLLNLPCPHYSRLRLGPSALPQIQQSINPTIQSASAFRTLHLHGAPHSKLRTGTLNSQPSLPPHTCFHCLVHIEFARSWSI